MRKIPGLLLLAFMTQSCFAQHYVLQSLTGPTGVSGATGSSIYQDGSGNLGIGNTAPAADLHVTEVTGAASVIQSDYIYPAGASYPYGVSNYFTASRIPESLAFPGPGYTYGSPVTDFSVNSVGQVGIGGAASGSVDLKIQDHNYSCSGFGSICLGAIDNANHILFLGTNVGSSTVPSGAILIASNSNEACSSANTAFLILDQSNTLNPIFAVGGNGVAGIGTSDPMAQLDIVKNSSVGNLLHVANGSLTHPDIFTINNDGYLGVGQTNSGSSLVEVSDANSIGSTTPLLQIDNGTPTTTAPYFKLWGSSTGVNVGIGIDPLAYGGSSTLALRGVGGTLLGIFNGSGGEGTGGLVFVSASGTANHLFTNTSAGTLTITPGLTVWPAGVMEISGNEQVDYNQHVEGNVQVDGHQNVTGNQTIAGNQQINGTVTIGANPAPGNPYTSNFTSYQLSVDGQIIAKEVVVNTTGWSDTVFSNTYKLNPLSVVENYVYQNHHLPQIPSEQDVMKNGFSLGEMNKLLLQKIEELTLYTINLEKRLRRLEGN